MFPWQRVGRIWNNVPLTVVWPQNDFRFGYSVYFVQFRLCTIACASIAFIQTPRIIIEHYGSRYNIALAFLVSFLPLSTA